MIRKDVTSSIEHLEVVPINQLHPDVTGAALIQPTFSTTNIPAPIIKQYKPKYDSWDLQSNSPEHLAVFISEITAPNYVYIQIEDKDVPRYQQLLKELQAEFNSATRQSASYCPLPIIGQPYAALLGNQWSRVLIEASSHGKEAFYVDTGHRLIIQPDMVFHELAGRFMELPAQSIRCYLKGVFPLNSSCDYPEEIYDYLRRFVNKPAVAFFSEWKAGQVGYLASRVPPYELSAFVTLYPNDEMNSINLQLARNSLVRLRENSLQLPEHFEIIRILTENQRSNQSAETQSMMDTLEEDSDSDSSIGAFTHLSLSSKPNHSLPKEEERLGSSTSVAAVSPTIDEAGASTRSNSPWVVSEGDGNIQGRRSITSDYASADSEIERSTTPVLTASRPSSRSSTSSSTAEPVPSKRFIPKFSRMDIKFNKAVKYASVLITKAVQPGAVYVRIQDDDVPRYNRMLKELQEEFSSATPRPGSYCPSPIVGCPYAALFGSQWSRVLIEKAQRYAEVFYVDIGHRQALRPSMMLFNLPERFLELPAQAVRCSLKSVAPPRNGKTFPQQIFDFMASRYNGKEAVAFFDSWHVGQVGNPGDSSAVQELATLAVLYLNETVPRKSINTELGQSSMASLSLKGIDEPMHSDIRKRLKTLPVHLIETSRAEILPSFPIPAVESINPSPDDETTAICRNIREEFSLPATFVSCQSPESLFFRTPELVKKFIRLHTGLQTYFDQGSVKKEMVFLKVGFIGAVCCQESWFRVEVIDIENYPKIGIFLMDNGCSRSVHASEIRRLPEGLDEIPMTLLRCSLYGIYPPYACGWNGESITESITNRLEGDVRIFIGSQTDPKESVEEALPVTVYLQKQGRGQMMFTNFNKELVLHGFASN